MLASLLFLDQPAKPLPSDTACFQDLNLALIFDQIQKESSVPIENFFYQPLTTRRAVEYRQAIFADLQKPTGFQIIRDFVTQAAVTTGKIEQAKRHWTAEQRAASLLNALAEQHQQLQRVTDQLQKFSPRSLGLQRLNEHFTAYLRDPATQQLLREVQNLITELGKIHFQLTVNGRFVSVASTAPSAERLSRVADQLFGPVMAQPQDLKRPNQSIKPLEPVNRGTSLQANVVRALHKLYPDTFKQLIAFYQRYQNYEVAGYDQAVAELNWYLAVLRYTNQLAKAGQLSFTLPTMVALGQPESIDRGFDEELAYAHAETTDPVVPNNFRLKPDEQFLIISGPNQGGKTTYTRMIGQAYYLASLGMPIAGEQAALHLASHVLTHFERQEKAQELTGLLQHDIERLKTIYDQVDDHSVVLMNELFSSTTAADAERLGQLVLKRLAAANAHGIYVTFLETLVQLPHMVAMQAQIIKGTTDRAYQIIRQSGTTNAYAASLLTKYQLTAAAIERRLEHARQSDYTQQQLSK